MKRFLLGALLLAVVVGLLYAPTASFGFLHLDDHDYTFRCPFVFDGLSWANVKAAFMNVRHAGVWMPLTYISYMTDISLFGPGPGPHHLVNVLLHLINTLLLLALAGRLARGKGGFWILLAVAFWALHPQRAEAVAWIAGRKELLWSCFALLGLLCWERGMRAGACLCCALACMSKPTAMCFPVLALCVDWAKTSLPSGQGCPDGSNDNAPFAAAQAAEAQATTMRELCSRALPYLPLVLMAIATGALAMYSQTHPEGHEVRALFSASLPWRLLNAAVAIGLSIFQMIVPIGIHLDYRAVPGQWPLHGLLGCLTFAGCLVLGAWCFVRGAWCSPCGQDAGAKVTHQAPSTRHQALLIALLWFLAAILPTLGIFGSFGEHARADRFLYLPMMAVAMAAALWPKGVLGASCGQDVGAKATHQALSTILVLALLALAASSWPVIDSYRNDEAAFTRTLAFDPDNGRALAHVGQAECAQRCGIDRGIEHLRRSQAVRPRDDTAAQLAYALAMRGHSADFAEIRRLCSKFACDHQLDKKGQALEALGMTAMRQRRWSEAIGCLYDSIRAPQRFYSNEDAMLKLAACLCNAGRQGEAMKWLEQLTRSKRTDIRGKAVQSLETLKRNPRAVLFLD